MLQKTRQSQQIDKDKYYFKNINKAFNSNDRVKSLSSLVKSKSQSFLENRIQLSDSYYNDRQNIYLKKSRLLSEKSITYQSKDISFSQRKKYNMKKIQNIVQNRDRVTMNEDIRSKTMSLPSMMNPVKKEHIRNRLNSLNQRKFSQLIHGSKPIERKIKILVKQTKENRSQGRKQEKWMSPFRDTNTFKAKFQGKGLVPKKIQGILANSNSTQLKVMNLDRLFRVKDGKLSNVIPIPVAKLSSISTRTNIVRSIKKKQTIHEIIEQYNILLRIGKLQKTQKKIGIRGHNFTKSPTLQQLMGIKMHQYHRKKLQQKGQQQQLNEEIFFSHNAFYKKHMKKDIHLSRRLITGLKQKSKFNLQAYTRFYSIFINKVSPLNQTVKFLLYFFIPVNQQKIELGILKLILQLMCQQLPLLTSITKVQEQISLTKEQKSKIFLEALNRVLFSDLKQFIGDGQVMINRSILEIILLRNQDAVSLLTRLLMNE